MVAQAERKSMEHEAIRSAPSAQRTVHEPAASLHVMKCKDAAGSWTVRWALGAALIASCSMLFLSACATMQGEREAQGGRFEFGLIGDVPYDGRAEREFAHVMKGLDAADL